MMYIIIEIFLKALFFAFIFLFRTRLTRAGLSSDATINAVSMIKFKSFCSFLLKRLTKNGGGYNYICSLLRVFSI